MVAGPWLELHSQPQLACTVSAVLRVLHILDYPKGGGRHICGRRSEIRMIQDIGESAFKAKVHALGQVKRLGQSSGDRRGAGPLQDTYAAISHRTRRNRIEGVDIEHAAGCGICDIPVADAIRPLKGAAIGQVQISRIVVRACRGREIRPGLPQADGAEGPSAEG